MINQVDQIIQHILKKKEENIKKKLLLVSFDSCIIKYIQRKYTKEFSASNKTVIIYTIEKFLEKISGLSLSHIDYILLFFFEILKKKNSVLAKNFNDFLKWAPNILNDFHDLDINLIKLKSFFSYIISTEKIKEWNPNILEIEKKNFFFWEEIYKIYYILQCQLLKKGKAYFGMLFRISFLKLRNFFSKNRNIQIVFFLTKSHFVNECEKKFINKMIQLNQESLLIYNLFSSNNKKKKNLFLKKNYYDFFIQKKYEPISKKILHLEKIKIISVSKEIEQIHIVEKIISRLIKNGKKPHKIIIMLGDNYLSIPLFHSLKKITGVHLSIMNYPFKFLPIHSTFYSIFQLLLRKEKFKNFHKEDIMRILSDGYIQKIFLRKKLLLEIFNTKNLDFISESMINKYLSKNDLEIIFKIQTNKTKKCIIGIISFIKLLKTFFFLFPEKHLLELKFLSVLEIYMKKMKILVRKTKNSFFLGIKDVFNLYQQFINTEKIQYKQPHPQGLSMIGFMDPYFGDFETTIITSVNEGIIPPDKKKYNTFIPLDIRKKLNLPIFQENEEIYQHHLINILQTSKNVYLIYKNQPDELNSGEKSRFIYQIEMNCNNFTTEKKENIPLFISKRSPIVIKKTESIIRRLDELSRHGFSPSSIHLYNCNPLLFYYKKIIGLKNPEEISFKQKIGKIVHKILEILYKPIKGRLLTIDFINTIKKDYEFTTKKFLLEEETQTTFLPYPKGRKMLLLSIVKTYIKNFISWDEKLIQKGHQIFMKELEYSISTELEDIRFQKVNLYGIIDRIDEFDGTTRIIDYKIGIQKLKRFHISLNKIANIFHDPNHVNIMQLLIYVYLWFKSSKFVGYKEKPPIIGIVSPEKGVENSILTTPIIFKKTMNISYKNYVENFFPHLVNRIFEILDPKIPIIENTNFSDF
ncbi:PD-(D/E)XK nuclease family protein [Blattabacterium cuenoti]|uniref:PD-(D/E)XK nuclease family protein n=1 Tax=Blattabacterium cuenoti TaxID=1653831 RepID=UPI00163CADF8|nr:PD-(D/E)XK nuclease family protein [Blattabacterium cuenoti]